MGQKGSEVMFEIFILPCMYLLFSLVCLFVCFFVCCDRYEGNRFVEEVHTDYVVWEETGRTEYGYTATMSEVRIVIQRDCE